MSEHDETTGRPLTPTQERLRVAAIVATAFATLAVVFLAGFGIGRATDCHDRPIMHKDYRSNNVVFYEIVGFKCE